MSGRVIRTGLALLLLAGCGRTFRAPPTTGDAPPRVDELRAPVEQGAFAGEPVVLSGANFSTAAEANQVRVGQSLAAIDPDSPASATALTFVMPALDPALSGTDLEVTVAVGGQVSNARKVRYRGLGHPASFALVPGTDLSPTPRTVSVLAGSALVSLLRNRVHALVSPGDGFILPFVASPGALPFGEALTLAQPPNGFGATDGGGEVRLGLWSSEVAFEQGQAAQILRSNALDSTADGLSMPPVLTGICSSLSGTDCFVPTGGSDLVSFGYVAATDPRLEVLDGGARYVLSVDRATYYDPDGGTTATDLVVLATDGTSALLQQLTVAGGQVVASPARALSVGGTSALPTASALAPDGRTEWLLYGSSFSGASLYRVDAFSGDPVVQARLPSASFVAASLQHVVTGSILSPDLTILDSSSPSGLQQVGTVTLPGPPLMLTRDELGLENPATADHVYALVPTPPRLVEVDAATATIVRSTALNNGSRIVALDRAGRRLAASGFSIAGTTVLDVATLTDVTDFQHVADPGTPDVSGVMAASFRALPDGGTSDLCAFVVRARVDQNLENAPITADLRCGPPEDLYGPRGTSYMQDSPVTGALPLLSLAALDDGRLRLVLANGPELSIATCPSVDGSGCDVEDAGRGGTALALVPSEPGGALLVRAGEVSLYDGQGWTAVCSGAPDCGKADDTVTAAIDAARKRAVVLGHISTVYDVASGRSIGGFQYFSDQPLSVAFSADGSRLYVGTLLGHFDEYDVARLVPGLANLPSRTLVAGFPIQQIVAAPDGSRVLLVDPESDRIWVVQ